MVRRVPDAVEHGIAQVDVRGAHVDAGPQRHAAVGVQAFAHFLQQTKGFFCRAIAPGRVHARFSQGAAHLAHRLRVLLIDVSVSRPDQRLREAVHDPEIVAGEIQVLGLAGFPVKTQPFHGLDDRVDVFLFFLFGVRVIKAQVADAAVVPCEAEIQADALGVSDVQVAVGLRRKPRADARRISGGVGQRGCRTGRARPALALKSACGQVRFDDIA